MLALKTIRELSNAFYAFEGISSKHIRSLGLTPGQFDVVATLGNQPPMTCTELAEKSLMVKGNLSVVLDGLLKKNVITRVVNKNDGRSRLIGLTEVGEKLFKTIFPLHLAYILPIVERLDEAELLKLKQSLILFRNAIEGD